MKVLTGTYSGSLVPFGNFTLAPMSPEKITFFSGIVNQACSKTANKASISNGKLFVRSIPEEILVFLLVFAKLLAAGQEIHVNSEPTKGKWLDPEGMNHFFLYMTFVALAVPNKTPLFWKKIESLLPIENESDAFKSLMETFSSLQNKFPGKRPNFSDNRRDHRRRGNRGRAVGVGSAHPTTAIAIVLPERGRGGGRRRGRGHGRGLPKGNRSRAKAGAEPKAESRTDTW